MTRSERYRPLLFWLAVATAATALLPIVAGALVTTLDAGMAFRDWPTSDGQGMLSYPWLHSAGDKFIEHGHRLAGIVIGCVSIVFAASAWLLEPRRWVRWCALGVLLAVVAQGLLGGGRVLADARLFAMVHGAFAAAVFAFMSSMALVLSRSWIEPPRVRRGDSDGDASRFCRPSRRWSFSCNIRWGAWCATWGPRFTSTSAWRSWCSFAWRRRSSRPIARDAAG